MILVLVTDQLGVNPHIVPHTRKTGMSKTKFVQRKGVKHNLVMAYPELRLFTVQIMPKMGT